MESIPTNIPVLARAFEFSQEAKHRRELEQQAAVKTENTLNEQHANRVTFSQEAQTRLNEEKTHAANLVKEVRNASRAAAAEERSQAMSEAHRQAVEARVEDRNLRVERDSIARMKTEVANKAVAATRRVAEKVAAATQKITEDATAKAIEQRALKAEEFNKLVKTDDLNRTIKAQTQETNDLLEKQKRAVVVKNIEIGKDNVQIAMEHSKKVKTTNERVQTETAKAMKMYQHIDSMR